jgi:cell division protein FtsB
LREDPAAIEDIARRDLGLIKPGEKLFIIKDVVPGERLPVQ